MPVVTRISEQRRRKNRRSVFLDGAFAFGCNLNVVARFRLREGLKLSAMQVQEILAGEVRQEVFDDALRLLQNRLHSRRELALKLRRKEHAEPVIESVLEQLESLGYLDDARFAETRAASFARHRHHGRRRTRVELIRAGIDSSTADRAIGQVYETHDSTSAARLLAEKHAARLSRVDPVVARRRLVGMLQRRGYTYDEIKPVVDQVLGAERQSD